MSPEKKYSPGAREHLENNLRSAIENIEEILPIPIKDLLNPLMSTSHPKAYSARAFILLSLERRPLNNTNDYSIYIPEKLRSLSGGSKHLIISNIGLQQWQRALRELLKN